MGSRMLAMGAAACLCQSAMAQTADGGLDEIVVTAQKRSESIQNVGISISAFSAEQLDSMHLDSAKDVVNHIAGVLVNDNFGAFPSYVIRGIGQNDFEANTSPSAAVYVDDVYQANTIAGSPLVFDLDRVEVLKGPQGTLYGRNSSSGAVSLISRRPTDHFEVEAQVGAGEYGHYEAQGAVSGPITDTLAYRVSGKGLRQDSPYDMVTPNPAIPAASGAAFAPRDSAFRGQLQWRPGADTTVLFLAHYAQQNGIAENWQAIPTTQIPGAAICPGRNGPADPAARAGCQAGYAAGGFVVPPSDPFTVSVNFLQPMDNRFMGFSGHVDHTLPFATLTSITAYEDFHFFRNWDEDGTVIQGLNFQEDIHFHQLSEELRLAGRQGRIDWLLGAFYSSDSDHDDRVAYAGNLINGIGTINYVGASGRVGPTSPHFADRLATANALPSNLTQITNSAALFTDDEVQLTDQLALVAGYRFSYEKRRFHGFGGVRFTDGTTGFADQNNLGDAVGDVHIETRRSSGRVGLNWQLDPHKLLYVLASDGFKSGGYDGTVSSNFAQTFTPYKPEVVTSGEAGFKTDWSHLRVNGDLFHSHYEHPQARIRHDVLAADGVTIIPQTQLSNLDAAKAQGAELEITWRPLKGLTFDSSATYLNTRIQQSGPLASIYDGNPLPFAPRFSVTLGGQYEWLVGRGLMAGVGVDSKYLGNHYMRPEQFAIDKQHYTVVDVLAHLGSESGTWQVEFYGKNVGNEEYRTNAVGGIGADVFALSQPATWGLTARVKM
jgi:iron complex outermembrane recepter protein